MEIVSELLGHSNMVITQESYGKVIQKKVNEKIKNKNRNERIKTISLKVGIVAFFLLVFLCK
jgi:hypothetical protein